MNDTPQTNSIALVGFGEAGATFAIAAGWRRSASAVDIDPARESVMKQAGVQPSNPREAMANANLVLSLVTADQALAAAEAYASLLRPGTIWCDMNSVAPDTKRQAAKPVAAAGAHYVDVAILAPVHPARLGVPLLLSGPAADEAEGALRDCKFTNLRVVGHEIGEASAIKMIRSVMVKGIEALTDEMMSAAEAAGVVDEVLASLDASEKTMSWRARAAYNLDRMTTHGLRRAAEMEEAAKTLVALGVEPVMTNGTLLRQRDAAERGDCERTAA